MATTTNSEQHQKAVDLAEEGKYEQALACINERLQTTPDDVEALNDAGVILHCLGRSEEAIECLAKARTLEADSAEIAWNLVETYLAEGRASEAVPLFEQMEQMETLNADVLNRSANIFLNQENHADALRMLEWSLRLWPDQEILKPMIEVIRIKMAESQPE
jgi:Flp pilus assembly protein TadD